MYAVRVCVWRIRMVLLSSRTWTLFPFHFQCSETPSVHLFLWAFYPIQQLLLLRAHCFRTFSRGTFKLLEHSAYLLIRNFQVRYYVRIIFLDRFWPGFRRIFFLSNRRVQTAAVIIVLKYSERLTIYKTHSPTPSSSFEITLLCFLGLNLLPPHPITLSLRKYSKKSLPDRFPQNP